MKRRRSKPTVYVGDHTDKLTHIPAHRSDPDDERPTREDRAPQGSQLFKVPELPRFLRSKRSR